MIDGELFSKIENIARVLRENGRPFGGIQLVLCGYVIMGAPLGVNYILTCLLVILVTFIESVDKKKLFVNIH